MNNQDHWKSKIMSIYGVDHPSQDPVIRSKMHAKSYSKKDFTFPSGKVVQVMGWEPCCIQELLKTYSEDDIVVTTVDIPVIWYNKIKIKKETGDKYEEMGAYYPDIMLPDRLIEVKSTWTYVKDAENNERKFRECAKQGWKIEVWIYSKIDVLQTRRVYHGTEVYTI